MHSTVRPACDKLLSLRAPRPAGDLVAEHRSVLTVDKLFFRKVRHQQVTVRRDNSAERGQLWRGVGDELSDGLARRAQFESGGAGTLAQGLHLVDGEAPPRFGRDD